MYLTIYIYIYIEKEKQEYRIHFERRKYNYKKTIEMAKFCTINGNEKHQRQKRV